MIAINVHDRWFDDFENIHSIIEIKSKIEIRK